jgi:hypothetical protein
VACSPSIACNTPLGPFTICDVPFRTCNPVANTGCPDAALACYVQGSGTICDCSGTKQPGQSCAFIPDCVPGYTCIIFGAGQGICEKTCTTSTDCAPPTPNCNIVSGMFGYCGA